MTPTIDEINELLEELLCLEREIRPMLQRIDEIKTWCKIQGSFSTDLFACVVQPMSRRSLVGLEIMKKVLRVTDEELVELGLLKTVIFMTVHVGRKVDLR